MKQDTQQENAEKRLEEKLRRATEQIASLRAQLERDQKQRKRFEKYRAVLVISALPVLLLFLPIILAYMVFRALQRRARRARIKRASGTPNGIAQNSVAMPGLDAQEVVEFLSGLDEPLIPPPDAKETISVIIPSFNNSKLLESAVKSAIYQFGVRVEVIIVDDFSTDGSLAVAEQLAAKYPSIKVIPLLRNFGCYYARNIGLLESTGDFIAIIDSDDIMHPTRLARQLAVLKADRSSIASRSEASRWTFNFENRISERKAVENTLLFPRKLIDEIGYYDCVRYAGDSEFRERIQSVYGSKAIPLLEQELYYLRTSSNSLTQQSATYTNEGGALVENLSLDRFLYKTEFRRWHLDETQRKKVPYIGFPQTNREFELDHSGQNASPSLGQNVVGGLATFPAREQVLKSTLPSILRQVDRLHVYLNQYEAVPDFLNHPKVIPVLGPSAMGDLRDNGKFYGLIAEDGYIFTFDDDIHYPSDYVAKMVAYIENFGRNAVLGAHGVIFPNWKTEYLSDRTVFKFDRKASWALVDLLGTGTVAFHSSTIDFTLDDFETKGICDLWFARIAAEKRVPLISVARENKWLIEAEHRERMGLYEEARQSDGEHTKLFHRYLYDLVAMGKARNIANEKLCGLLDVDRLSALGLTNGPENFFDGSINRADPK